MIPSDSMHSEVSRVTDSCSGTVARPISPARWRRVAGALLLLSCLGSMAAAPFFDTHPQPQNLEAGDILALTAFAQGTTPLTLTWYQDGRVLNSTTGDKHDTAYTILAVQESHAGDYSVVARNSNGSVTSQVARVVVRPAPPNPEHRGRRFVHFAETGQAIEGTSDRPSILANRGARWWGNQLLFTALSNPGEKPMGLLAAGPEGPARVLLAPGTELPHGLGALGSLALPTGARRDDPILFLGCAGTEWEPSGLYRWDQGSLVALVDKTTDIPGAPGEPIIQWGAAVQRGESVLFTASTAQRWGAYVSSPAGLRRLADTTQDLPGLGRTVTAFFSPAYDGTNAAVGLWSDTLGYLGVLRLGANGEIETILRRGDPIPGTTETIQDGRWLAIDGEAIYQSAPGPSIREWRNGQVRRIVSVLTIIEEVGFVNEGDDAPLFADSGNLYTRLRTGPGSYHHILQWTPDGRLRGIPLTKLDARRVGTTFFDGTLHGVDRGQLAVTVGFFQLSDDRPFALYGNLLPVLHPVASGPNSLRLEIPQGTSLESSPTGSGPWEPMAGSGTVQIPTTAPRHFYRLRQP